MIRFEIWRTYYGYDTDELVNRFVNYEEMEKAIDTLRKLDKSNCDYYMSIETKDATYEEIVETYEFLYDGQLCINENKLCMQLLSNENIETDSFDELMKILEEDLRNWR